MNGGRSRGVDDTPKGVVMMINHEFKLGKEGREDIKRESDCENVVESMYFMFH